jgi:hypothetical protein
VGPKNQQTLIDWQQQLATGFVYEPDASQIIIETELIKKDLVSLKQKIEMSFRKEFQSLCYTRQNLVSRATVLESQINELSQRTSQVEIDLMSFRRFAA